MKIQYVWSNCYRDHYEPQLKEHRFLSKNSNDPDEKLTTIKPKTELFIKPADHRLRDDASAESIRHADTGT